MKTAISIFLTILIFASLFLIFTNKILITILVYSIAIIITFIVILLFYAEVVYPMVDSIFNNYKRKNR